MKRAQGIDSHTALQQSLDDLGKMEEFDGLKDQINGMLAKSNEREEEFDFVKKAREKKIAMQYAEMSSTYGRVFTPSRQSTRSTSAKVQMIEEEDEQKKKDLQEYANHEAEMKAELEKELGGSDEDY